MNLENLFSHYFSTFLPFHRLQLLTMLIHLHHWDQSNLSLIVFHLILRPPCLLSPLPPHPPQHPLFIRDLRVPKYIEIEVLTAFNSFLKKEVWN